MEERLPSTGEVRKKFESDENREQEETGQFEEGVKVAYRI
jgi:hypothetical protein